jgi:hypothetical protein
MWTPQTEISNNPNEMKSNPIVVLFDCGLGREQKKNIYKTHKFFPLVSSNSVDKLIRWYFAKWSIKLFVWFSFKQKTDTLLIFTNATFSLCLTPSLIEPSTVDSHLVATLFISQRRYRKSGVSCAVRRDKSDHRNIAVWIKREPYSFMIGFLIGCQVSRATSLGWHMSIFFWCAVYIDLILVEYRCSRCKCESRFWGRTSLLRGFFFLQLLIDKSSIDG